MQDDVIKIGNILRKAREAKGMTQAALAEVTGVATRTIMDIENDKRYPTYEVFFKVIRALDFSADHIFWPEKQDCTPEQEQITREYLACSEWEQKIISNTVRALVRSLRDQPEPAPKKQ